MPKRQRQSEGAKRRLSEEAPEAHEEAAAPVGEEFDRPKRVKKALPQSDAPAAASASSSTEAPAGVSGLSDAELRAGGVSMSSFKGIGTERVPYKNKRRVLVLASRGIHSRYRHLMEDLRALMPHHKKDSKVRRLLMRRRNAGADALGCSSTPRTRSAS
jgi:hypothetical protein